MRSISERVKKIMSDNVNEKNSVEAVNMPAVSIVTYCAVIVKFGKEELRQVDQRTRKVMRVNEMPY